MEFEWDENKNSQNIAKHFIDFEDIKPVFGKKMIVKEDKRKNYGEKRFIGIGEMKNIAVVVVWTLRNNKIRLISARKANLTERKIYYENID